MKNKLLIPVLLIFGLFAGTASAVTVNLASFEILTIGDGIIPSGGIEVDNFSQIEDINAGAGDVAVSKWVGIDVIVPGANSIITSETQVTPGGATSNLDLAVYAASVVGSAWTTGALLDTALPSPLVIGFATGTYLINFSGTLEDALVDIRHTYGVRISSVVPVPAAVWLFGTALFGLLGVRRRKVGMQVAA